MSRQQIRHDKWLNGVFHPCVVYIDIHYREQLDLCCDVLKKLFSPLPVQIILTQFRDELKTGFKHPEIAVRKLCLSEVIHCYEYMIAACEPLSLMLHLGLRNSGFFLLSRIVHVDLQVFIFTLLFVLSPASLSLPPSLTVFRKKVRGQF